MYREPIEDNLGTYITYNDCWNNIRPMCDNTAVFLINKLNIPSKRTN